MILTKVLNEYLSQDERPWVDDRVFKIRTSALGSPCLRKVFYQATNTKEDFPIDLVGKKRMLIGTELHHELSQIFKKSGVAIDFINPDGSTNFNQDGLPNLEFVISAPDLDVKKGKIDLVAVIDGKLWLGEYKSINSRGFVPLISPKSDHLIQGVLYLYAFNQMLREGKFAHIKRLDGFTSAEGISFFYICKDTSEIKEFVITEASEIFRQIVDRIVRLKNHFLENTLPERTKDYCNTCPFRNKCKKNQLF